MNRWVLITVEHTWVITTIEGMHAIRHGPYQIVYMERYHEACMTYLRRFSRVDAPDGFNTILSDPALVLACA